MNSPEGGGGGGEGGEGGGGEGGEGEGGGEEPLPVWHEILSGIEIVSENRCHWFT